LPIGFLEGASLSAAGPSLTMQPGDLLILATDGAIELRSTEGEMFGRQRLERLISEHAQLPASTLVSVLSDAIRGFHPEQHPPDDVTLLILERKLT
jgi:sigma-B regulation protein RsbU (phosphoserine phosphatase)